MFVKRSDFFEEKLSAPPECEKDYSVYVSGSMIADDDLREQLSCLKEMCAELNNAELNAALTNAEQRMDGVFSAAVFGHDAIGSGLNKQFAKTVAMQVAAQVVAAVVSVWNLLIAMAMLGALVIQAIMQQNSRAVETAKQKVSEAMCDVINKESQKLAENMIGQTMSKISECKDYVGASLNAEIEQMTEQLNGMIAEKEKGEDNIRALLEELDGSEARLRDIEKKLTGFVFELLQ